MLVSVIYGTMLVAVTLAEYTFSKRSYLLDRVRIYQVMGTFMSDVYFKYYTFN